MGKMKERTSDGLRPDGLLASAGRLWRVGKLNNKGDSKEVLRRYWRKELSRMSVINDHHGRNLRKNNPLIKHIAGIVDVECFEHALRDLNLVNWTSIVN
jgi:hypothetical protein